MDRGRAPAEMPDLPTHQLARGRESRGLSLVRKESHLSSWTTTINRPGTLGQPLMLFKENPAPQGRGQKDQRFCFGQQHRLAAEEMHSVCDAEVHIYERLSISSSFDPVGGGAPMEQKLSCSGGAVTGSAVPLVSRNPSSSVHTAIDNTPSPIVQRTRTTSSPYGSRRIGSMRDSLQRRRRWFLRLLIMSSHSQSRSALPSRLARSNRAARTRRNSANC